MTSGKWIVQLRARTEQTDAPRARAFYSSTRRSRSEDGKARREQKRTDNRHAVREQTVRRIRRWPHPPERTKAPDDPPRYLQLAITRPRVHPCSSTTRAEGASRSGPGNDSPHPLTSASPAS